MQDHLTSIFCYKNQKAIYLKYYISNVEHKDITETIGDAGVILYMHYLRMASLKDPDFTDQNSANTLGWNLRKVQRYRTALTKNNYYKAIRYSRSDGYKGTDFHIGKEAVERIRKL